MSDSGYPDRRYPERYPERGRPPERGGSAGWPGNSLARTMPQSPGGPANLADILERVLDKGIVIAGDIKINLVDVELLTIKLRLLVASVDRAKEMGIDWWERDPALSSKAADRRLMEENERLRRRLAQSGEMPGSALESADPALIEENLRLRGLLAAESGTGAAGDPDDTDEEDGR